MENLHSHLVFVIMIKIKITKNTCVHVHATHQYNITLLTWVHAKIHTTPYFCRNGRTACFVPVLVMDRVFNSFFRPHNSLEAELMSIDLSVLF